MQKYHSQMSNSAKEIAQKWSVDRMSALEQNYISKGLRASGQFGDSLEEKIVVSPTGIHIQILGAPQVGIMTNGRKPNKNSSPEKIKAWVGWAGSTILRDWVKNKRLSLNPYAVAWKIAREGIKVPNQRNDGKLVEQSITAESIALLIKELGSHSIESLKSNYIKAWQ